MNTQDAKRVLQTALICAREPLSIRDMRTLFADELDADDASADAQHVRVVVLTGQPCGEEVVAECRAHAVDLRQCRDQQLLSGGRQSDRRQLAQ